MATAPTTTTTTTTATPRRVVRIGVFLPGMTQLLDTACVDVFGSMGIEYLDLVSYLVSPDLIASAPSVDISYITKADSHTAANPALIGCSSNARITATHLLNDPAVAPGNLDIVLIPGVDPRIEAFPKDTTDWLAAHAAIPTTDILSVCTGIWLCGAAGLLRGRRACGPRGMQDMIRKRFEDVELVGDKVRWMQDGNFWSCGGVTTGNDLVVAYSRQSRHFSGPLVDFASALLEVGDRPLEYNAA